MLSVEAINTYASKMTIGGWLIGLAYYNWFAPNPEHVSWFGHAALIVGGMFVASIVIGGGMAMLMGLITKLATGDWEGSSHAFAWGAFISPVLAFFAAKYALKLAVFL